MSVAAAGLDPEAQELAERRFRRGISSALGVGILALLILVSVAAWLYGRDQDTSVWVDHTYAAETKINALATEVERLEAARRGYLLSQRDGYWRAYVDARSKIRPSLDDLVEFTADNPVQARNLEDLKRLVEAKFAQLRESIELAHDGDLEGARRNFLVAQEQNVTQHLRERLDAMMDEERRLLAARSGEEHRNAQALLITTIIVAALLAGVSVGAMLLMRRYATELARNQAALKSLNAGLEDAVRARTADLTRANEEIQRFAYIVSHDLRSPLVNVMGFTSELEASLKPLTALLAAAEDKAPAIVTADARLAVREDMPEAINFIRTSTKKMDRLINAILQLSRQGRRTLTPERLDMDALALSVADTLATLARDKGAEITVEPGLPALTSDRVAVEQVLSNLVENAVKYLQPGRPGRVVVRSVVSGGRVLLEVEDNGRGIDPRDHERIFELFRRSGAQDTPGEGIGLAHVRALVYRLGGTITCVSELGRGSTFRVSLPATLVQDERTVA